MRCLNDYIGIKGCGLSAPASGMYINSLMGVEFQNIEQIANADQVSFVGVWNDVQERAEERFRLDVIGQLSGFDKRYRLREITQTVDLGIDLETAQQAPFAGYSGLVIELKNPGDDCICSNMQSIYVQSVQFYCVNAGAFTLKVFDADYKNVIDSFPVTGTQGWNIINVDKQYDGVKRVGIAVNTTALTTAFLDLSKFDLSWFGQYNWCSDCGSFDSGIFFTAECTGTAQVRGIQTDSNFSNPVFGINTFGISCVFSVKCTYNAVVCNNKRHFANAFRLCLGIELMSERIYSSRLNRWTTVDKGQASKLRREFEIQYRGGQLEDGIVYEGELKKACYGIDLDTADCCLEKDADFMFRESQL